MEKITLSYRSKNGGIGELSTEFIVDRVLRVSSMKNGLSLATIKGVKGMLVCGERAVDVVKELSDKGWKRECADSDLSEITITVPNWLGMPEEISVRRNDIIHVEPLGGPMSGRPLRDWGADGAHFWLDSFSGMQTCTESARQVMHLIIGHDQDGTPTCPDFNFRRTEPMDPFHVIWGM